MENTEDAETERLVKWRDFEIGGGDSKTLTNQLKSRVAVSKSANYLIGTIGTGYIPVQIISSIILTPTDFGYTDRPTTKEFLNPKRLGEWGSVNARRLPEGYTLALMSPETGPYICMQYDNQPRNETLWIAMEPLRDADNELRIFSISRSIGPRGRYFQTYNAEPCFRVFISRRFLFRLVPRTGV